MCGIAGEVSGDGEPVAPEEVRTICYYLKHRGPDEGAYFAAPEAVLGVRRLKVIGLQGGEQPAYNGDQTVVCVFNGEIYNHRALRAKLREMGQEPRGTSDAHLIPYLYELLGTRFVHELTGMFAIAIWDTRRKRLVLAVDRLGKKPLYVCRTRRDSIAFASELGALMHHSDVSRGVDSEAVDEYLSYRIIGAPRTIYRDVQKLPPGTMMICDASGTRSERYWQVDFGRTRPQRPVEEWVAELDSAVNEAVVERLDAEVPIGAMLSGGVDSSLVAALAIRHRTHKLPTFSIGFRERDFDEKQHSDAVASFLGTEHHHFQIEVEHAEKAVDHVLRHVGEPYAFPSAIACYYMFWLAAQHVTVVLTGDGADEVFCGYRRYTLFRDLQRGGGPIETRYAAVLMDGLRDDLKSRLCSPRFKRSIPGPFPLNRLQARLAPTGAWKDEIDRIMQMDCGFWLPDAQLVKIDRMAMAHAVEPRSPLLAHEVVDLGCRIPSELKLTTKANKYVLRRVAMQYLPASIADRPKQELAVPLERWLTTHMRARVQETLLREECLERGYFDADELREFVGAFRPESSYALWTLYMLERWHQLNPLAVAGI